MVKIATEVQGADQLARKVRRMPAELRERVAEAAEFAAKDHARAAFLASPSGRIKRSTRALKVEGSQGTVWISRQGGDKKAWFARLQESGTRPGLREHRTGPRVGLVMDHPGTTGTGSFYGSYRLRRRLYRARFAKAYRDAGKAIAASGGSTNINLTGRSLTGFYG